MYNFWFSKNKKVISPFWFLLQVLENEGLNKYVDVETVKREIAEATDMTQEQLDVAAQKILRDAHTGGLKTPYYEHLGGYSAQELKDFNQYSAQGDLRRRQGYEEYENRDDKKMVYVTSL